MFNDVWVPGDTVNVAIGQGFLSVTPLELAVMTSRIANGGYKVRPYLIANSNIAKHNEELFTRSPMVKKETINVIKQGMYDVVNSPYGTACRSAINDENFEFGGKTGSSQVFRITEKLRREGKTVSDDYWKKEHAVFVGYAPADNPQIAVSVLIEHGGGGSHTAAPIARDVLLAAKKYLSL